MATATLLSRFLGLFREMVYARFLGDGLIKGAFDYAFMIPNLFRRLLGEGALTAAFIPIFKKLETQEGESHMWESANAVISALVIVSTLLVGTVFLALSLILAVANFDPEITLMLRLLRIMFPYMFFVCLAATFMGMLNARGFFFIPALGATLLNVVMIFTVVWLVPMIQGGLSTQIFALAYAVLVAGVAQAFFQWPFLHKNGYRWRWVSPWSHPTVQEVVRKMIPGTIGVAAFQLNMLITQGVAYWIDSGSTGSIIASFNYAVRLMEFPQGVFGVSLFTYLLSALSGYVAQKDYVSFRKTLCDGLHYLSFVNVFAMAVTLVLAGPIVRMVYEGGQFTPDSSSRTSAALLSLAPSLLAFSYVGSLARSFYALGDVKTPMTISIFCLFINLLLALILIHPFRQAGLGMANSISSWINFALLTYALRLKLKRLEWTNLPREIVQMILCAVIAAQVAWVIYHFGFQRSLQIPSPSFWLKLVSVVAPLSGASLVYWSAASFLRIRATMDIIHTIKSRRNAPLPD